MTRPRMFFRSVVTAPVWGLGHRDRQRDDRLEEHRSGAGEGVAERQLASAAEGDVLAVDRVGLAVGQDHADVLDRRAR
jgi:hypothetical protein